MKKLVFLLILITGSAHADLLCVKNRVKVINNSVKLLNNLKIVNDSSCPARHSLVKDLDTIQDQQIAAFAKIDQNGVVMNFGGTGVTGINVDASIPGRFEISFFGNFDLLTDIDSEENRNLFTVNSTAIADNYGVTNNSISSASNSGISVTVFLWKSDTNFDQSQSGVNVTIFKGNQPIL
jgi:hypothetical protein